MYILGRCNRYYNINENKNISKRVENNFLQEIYN